MRLAVYTDYSYRRKDGELYGERAFVLFLDRLTRHFEKVVVPGRLDPGPGRAHYRLSQEIEFVALPHYGAAGARPLQAAWGMLRGLRRFWRVLDGVDAVWLLGPHPLCLPLWAMAAVRGKGVALGVRQNTPVYMRARHPGRRPLHLIADALDASFRLLSRLCPTVVVGPELARRYGRARRLLEISVSLVDERDVVDPDQALARPYDGELRALSVGRLETEKNPLLLADVLERLNRDGDRRWRLEVCGEGHLERELAARLRRLGVEAEARLRGYMPLDGGLQELYRESHALLHVSWTEGVPQVLFEAFAAGLPVVATAVGGVEDAVGPAALLVQPGDADAAAAALRRVAQEPEVRERLVREGVARVRERTLGVEARRVAEFLAAV